MGATHDPAANSYFMAIAGKFNDGAQHFEAQLDSSQQEIRVLVLHPGNFHDPINCTLGTVSLKSCPHFNALSYVWGDSRLRGDIVLNGVPITVTRNLETALRHLRSHPKHHVDTTATPLWVDAVCINQEDFDERNEQVRMMRDIYSLADRVVIWLGEGNADSDWAMERFSDHSFRDSLPSLGADPRRLTDDQVKASLILGEKSGPPPVVDEDLGSPGDGSGLQRPGPAMNCIESTEKGEGIARQVKSLPFIITSIYRWVRIRERYHQLGPMAFTEIFPALLSCRATDNHDLVYGTLGLASLEESMKITIDYRKPVEEVYREVMSIIWTSNPITSLRGAQSIMWLGDDTEDEISSILSHTIPSFSFNFRGGDGPSWIPDFAAQYDLESEPFSGSGLLGSGPWNDPEQVEISQDKQILRVRGIRLDVVDKAIHVLCFYGFSPDQTEPGDVNLLKSAEKMITEGKQRSVPRSSHLHPLDQLRHRQKVPEFLALAEDAIASDPELDLNMLWEVLLERQEMPRSWLPEESREEEDHDEIKTAMLSPLVEGLDRRLSTRKVFITEYGFAGVGTANLEEQDILVLPSGAACFYILRPAYEGYQMIGFAYVSGLMDFQQLRACYEQGVLALQTFDIC
ncbi:hypothetical protein INS49_010791 [Diaporthe citri]|uniref:uncharacterized protein n=1 Tax=Diaporthe citri TaxID=83186 RepID=UPI001C817685|nr:uncharacterized protein INS49_010791 [Diaporthe citri]KAG6359739.1 hypothetical protein INS49_010791 [Diaporthe citri]